MRPTLSACPRRENIYVSPPSGRSAAWLARPSGGREVVSSNLTGPTIAPPQGLYRAKDRKGRA